MCFWTLIDVTCSISRPLHALIWKYNIFVIFNFIVDEIKNIFTVLSGFFVVVHIYLYYSKLQNSIFHKIT